MKIVLISAYFFPGSSGGTERYVFDLAEMLQKEGHRVDVISSAQNEAPFTYKNIRVHCLKKSESNLASFKNKIETLQSDIAHFHTLTPAFDVAHMQLAKNSGYSVFFSSHIVGNTCIRGSLMRYGHIPCDGKVNEKTCLSCYINNKGFPVPVAKLMSRFIRLSGSPTALAGVVPLKKNQLKRIREICDGVLVFSDWQKSTFTENGFNPQKTHIVPHAWPDNDQPLITIYPTQKKKGLTLGFAGRISPEKGLHVLIDAFLSMPKTAFNLQIAGIPGADNGDYYNKLKAKTAGLSNIIWEIDLDEKQMTGFMHEIDVLCIPSLLFETGPYVLFEALAKGKPVIASRIGGMKEWAEKGFPVTLFTSDDSRDLARSLLNWQSPEQKTGRPVQSRANVTTAMLKLYQQKQPVK